MTLQARAEATRRTILVAAVEVIGEIGYPNTSLSEFIERAGVTKGAYYYHFPTRESLLVALVAEADELIATTTRGAMAPDGSSNLERLIRAAFRVADLACRDPRVRVGIQLRLAMGPASPATTALRSGDRTLIIQAVRSAVAEGDLRADINPEDVGHTLWIALLGNQYSAQTADAANSSLACLLRTILHGACTADAAPFFEHFVARTARQHVLSS